MNGASKDPQAVRGTVREKLPQRLYRVETQDGLSIVAGPSAEAKRLGLTLKPGTAVFVRQAGMDPGRGVIVGLA